MHLSALVSITVLALAVSAENQQQQQIVDSSVMLEKRGTPYPSYGGGPASQTSPAADAAGAEDCDEPPPEDDCEDEEPEDDCEEEEPTEEECEDEQPEEGLCFF